MKSLLLGMSTMIIGYILSNIFAGLGTDNVYMSYIDVCANAVLFLSGIISIWGFLILQELRSKKDK